MTDMSPSRKSVNQTMVDLVATKRKGKAIETAELMDRQPTLSDVHISDAEDSHPNTASSLRMQTAKLEHPLNGFPPCGSRWPMEMILLCEVAVRKKEAATRVQTRLLKQIGTQPRSRSSSTARRNTQAPFANVYTGIRSFHRKLEVRPIVDLQR